MPSNRVMHSPAHHSQGVESKNAYSSIEFSLSIEPNVDTVIFTLVPTQFSTAPLDQLSTLHTALTKHLLLWSVDQGMLSTYWQTLAQIGIKVRVESQHPEFMFAKRQRTAFRSIAGHLIAFLGAIEQDSANEHINKLVGSDSTSELVTLWPREGLLRARRIVLHNDVGIGYTPAGGVGSVSQKHSLDEIQANEIDLAKEALASYRDELVGVAEAAEYLHIDSSLVRRYAKQNRIGELVAGRYLFTRKELKKFREIERPVGNPELNAERD